MKRDLRDMLGGCCVVVLLLLGLVFFMLKVCGVIEWPWAHVLAPIWVPIFMGVTLVLTVVAISLAYDIIVELVGMLRKGDKDDPIR